MFYLVIVLLNIATILCMQEGDPCTLPNSQQSECRSLLKCPSAIQLIQNQKIPQTCGFVGTVPIVCCILKENSASDTTPTSNKFVSYTETIAESTTHNTALRNIPESESERSDSKNSIVSNLNSYTEKTTGNKSYEKCLEYSNLVKVSQQPPILFIEKEEVEVISCGFKIMPLIVGGVQATRKEFPHMALVGYGSSDDIQWTCGGSLISELYVLTAAHCLDHRQLGNATLVRLGVTAINDLYHRQDISILDRLSHPKFEYPSFYNDIGLIKLAKAAVFNEYVRPACLNLQQNITDTRALATGWGRMDFEGDSSENLLKVTLELGDAVICNKSLNREAFRRKLKEGIVGDTQICAGSQGKDTCQGDSGGPLQIYSKLDCMYEVIGVTSFGKACGIGRSPGVYTKVSYYLDWIEENVWE
ncbi:hypothetical protein HHI36_013359 [Cryptolaemus montrouzieri]|uniref:Serine protease snake n=1 Tax=Cryptolaemus montrouzieri TaxID=559131 RepID=A0ABD2NH79_9CUCU